jgi:ketosteroid isomerase-like protein
VSHSPADAAPRRPLARGSLLVAPLVLLVACGAGNEGEDARPEQDVLRQAAAYDAATLHGDSAALRHLLADEYRYVSSNGRVFDKEEALAWTQSPAYRLDSGRSDEVLVRVFGDAAVVVGRWTATGTNDGTAFHDVDRYTSVYVRRGGRWQIVSDHVSSIAARAAAPGPAASTR